MKLLAMSTLDISNQRVLIRSDLNVPMENGHITSDARLLASLPTYQMALDAKARIMIMSHFGRPTEGVPHERYSLAPIAKKLSHLLNVPVRLISNWMDHSFSVEPGEIVLFENVRFLAGETTNNEHLAHKMAQLCDVYVMDAFGTAHRAHASTYGVGFSAPIACAGPLLLTEIGALSHALIHPAQPILAIVGGSKVSTKLTLLTSLAKQCDFIIPGGGIANTFLAAAGHTVGHSLYEPAFIEQARSLMQKVAILLPSDVVVAPNIQSSAATTKSITHLTNKEMILDIGPKSITALIRAVLNAGTIIWNGPMGVFEQPAFAKGTRALAEAIAASKAFSIAGGGDTLAAIEKFQVKHQISYTSTGGGAFLEYIEGKELPAIAMLTHSTEKYRTPRDMNIHNIHAMLPPP